MKTQTISFLLALLVAGSAPAFAALTSDQVTALEQVIADNNSADTLANAVNEFITQNQITSDADILEVMAQVASNAASNQTAVLNVLAALSANASTDAQKVDLAAVVVSVANVPATTVATTVGLSVSAIQTAVTTSAAVAQASATVSTSTQSDTGTGGGAGGSSTTPPQTTNSGGGTDTSVVGGDVSPV